MRIIDCEQGSNKWHAARLGIPTASKFGCIVTPTGKLVTGATRYTYMMQLLTERITGHVTDVYVSADMERGKRLEPEARDWFCKTFSEVVTQVGFVVSDDGRYGASPDGLIGNGGVLEIKVPKISNHIAHLVENVVPAQWQVQIQGELLLCERDYCQFVMYCDCEPVPTMVAAIHRNDTVIDALHKGLTAFGIELDAMEDTLRKRYDLPNRKTVNLEALSADWCPFGDSWTVEDTTKEDGKDE